VLLVEVITGQRISWHVSSHVVFAGSSRRDAEYEVLAFERGVYSTSCEPDVLTRVCIDVTVGIAFLYFAVTCALLLRKLNLHKKVSYRMIQVGTVFFRLQVSPEDQSAFLFNKPALTSMPDRVKPA